MNLLNIFKRTAKETYRKSPRAHIYEHIATECKCSAQHVYDIAHGTPVKTYDDKRVHEALIRVGILVRDDQ